MASSSPRLLSLKDQPMLELLMKNHISHAPSKSTALWMGSEDEICGNYTEFLCAVARKGHRLETTVFTKALKEVYECDVGVLGKFAKALSHALSFARSKCSQVSSGSKLEAGVHEIVLAYQRGSQTSHDAPPSRSSSSSTCIAIDQHDGVAASSLAEAQRLFPVAQRSLTQCFSIGSSNAESPKKPTESKQVG